MHPQIFLSGLQGFREKLCRKVSKLNTEIRGGPRDCSPQEKWISDMPMSAFKSLQLDNEMLFLLLLISSMTVANLSSHFKSTPNVLGELSSSYQVLEPLAQNHWFPWYTSSKINRNVKKVLTISWPNGF
jgi:hypothetical protein